jgi:glutamate-ammonia-ligase adenylyltransferase
MPKLSRLIRDLPDPEAAGRFASQLAESNAKAFETLSKSDGLLSDVLTLASFSPLLATTMLQNPQYLPWLAKQRAETRVSSKDELLESLARFAMTNSDLSPQALYSRFRRRELLRIYLRDIRGLATIAEITEEISNLADAILEAALKEARQEMENRYGLPQETDEKGRQITATFCITALGKLGSKELNYSSDIDLVFIYSGEGTTSGRGTKGSVTNREYFVKLAEHIVRLTGQQTGESSAYRVDVRLRPHGTLGPLALSVADTVKYCRNEARPWERQVLIRSRAAAGNLELFRQFYSAVEGLVFSKTETVATALANVKRSKEKIDKENFAKRGFDVKLGRGGIREIEFLAQALQLAYGGNDPWLRCPHTLQCLSRLSDRRHISESEFTDLASAYTFLRRLEHVLQMKNGLQTHTVPQDAAERDLLAKKVMFRSDAEFEDELRRHTANVSRIFERVFGQTRHDLPQTEAIEVVADKERAISQLMASIDRSGAQFPEAGSGQEIVTRLAEVSPHFSARLSANPDLVAGLPDLSAEPPTREYESELSDRVLQEDEFGLRLAVLRRTWSRMLLEIVVLDIFGKIDIAESKRRQTQLAEASLACATTIVRDELSARLAAPGLELDWAILALGKLGGRGVDYDSDLDLVVTYFDPQAVVESRESPKALPGGLTAAEIYSRAVELLTTVLSSMTRDGSLYRVDLRLRPFGSKGMSAMSIDAFLNYMSENAAVWELLAFVKLRGVAGEPSLRFTVEKEARETIHRRAAKIDAEALKSEARRVRLALEAERSRSRRSDDIDIKYGPGGMLDVYFAMRYLQLLHNIPDKAEDRSTLTTLHRLLSNGVISVEGHDAFAEGYRFLSLLDHNIRITIGRSTRFPAANSSALSNIASRMGFDSGSSLLETLTVHRLNIRDAFDRITR